MNMQLSGSAPRLHGCTFVVNDDEVQIESPSGAKTIPAGLASAIVAGMSGRGPVTMPERVITVDQTNRSVVVDERFIVKFISRWGSADRAQWIEQTLASAQSSDVPGFIGALEWDHPELGRATIALVNEYVPGTSDGWTWAPDDVIRSVMGERSEDPAWPATLGALAARVHSALATADFPDDPCVRCDEAAHADAADELLNSYAGRTDATARRMRARVPQLIEQAETIPDDWQPRCTVTHGDLHVGQVIRSVDERYLLLDFDGNPQWARDTSFRREPVERDLAHMLNSIDLVAAVVQKRLRRVEVSAWAWADRAQQQFLRAYRSTVEQSEGLGADGWTRIDLRVLPALQAEQLLFELRYAAQFLPEWEYAPDAAISWRFPHHDLEETPWTPPDSLMT